MLVDPYDSSLELESYRFSSPHIRRPDGRAQTILTRVNAVDHFIHIHVIQHWEDGAKLLFLHEWSVVCDVAYDRRSDEESWSVDRRTAGNDAAVRSGSLQQPLQPLGL